MGQPTWRTARRAWPLLLGTLCLWGTFAQGSEVRDLFAFSRAWRRTAEGEYARFNLDSSDRVINESDLRSIVAGTPLPTGTPTATPSDTPTASRTPTRTPTSPLETLINDTWLRSGSQPSLDGREVNQYVLGHNDGGDAWVHQVEVRSGSSFRTQQLARWDDSLDPDVTVDADNRLFVAYDDGGEVNVWFWWENLRRRASVQGLNSQPAIACQPAGRSVVLWRQRYLGTDRIAGRLYDRDSTALSNPVYVSLNTSARTADIACGAGGRFLAVYTIDGDRQLEGVFIEPVGVLLSALDRFAVGLSDQNQRFQPRVAPLDAQGFVVVWEDRRQDDQGDIYAATVRLNMGRHEFINREFRVDAGEGGARRPVAGFVAGRLILFAWADNRNGPYQPYGALFDINGVRRSLDLRLDDPSVAAAGEVMAIALAVERVNGQPSGTRILVAWERAANLYLKLFRLRE